MDGKEIPGKSESFYSTEYGAITHKRITGLYKSKLKAHAFIARSQTVIKRGLRFSKDVLDKLDSYYSVPEEIEIVTHVTDVTGYGDRHGVNNDNLDNEDTQNHAQITSDIIENNDTKDPLILSKCVTTVTSVTEEPVTDHSTEQKKDPLMSQPVTTVTSVDRIVGLGLICCLRQS
jgi:ribosomal protein S18